MPDLSQILMQAQQMQADMQRAQASLAEAEVTGSAGSGLVTAVVNGSGDLLRLKIDPSVVDPADVETLEDLVIAAVHDARRAAEGVASSAMGSVTSGLDLSSFGLPGLGVPGFGAPELDDDDDFDDDDDDDDEDEDDGDEAVGIVSAEDIVVIEEIRPPDQLPAGGAEPGRASGSTTGEG
jgi:DNA-binding YbaB/EbfC family protein